MRWSKRLSKPLSRPWFRKPTLEGGWPAQRILVTGASGGIGRALVKELAATGAQVLASGRNAETLAALAAENPEHISVMAADLTDADARARLVEAARRADCNVLINAAGINHVGLFENEADDSIAELINVNLTATLQLIHQLLPQLMAAPQGQLVNVGSTFGAIGYPSQATYCATKFAMRGFSQALRRELADTRVRVLYVAPRATRTAMNSPEVEAMNEALGTTMDTPERVARAVRRAIEGQREETQVGWPEGLFVRLNAIVPRVVDRALHRQLPIIRRFVGKP
ncbi:short-subunit dehydrogenase [Onishia taeanensis]|uniref:Short-subunit dehydrogenase n=1 Tax=Onishia taeanensis TaxID=284577 RepID=A0A328XGG4_9GAMM|nr:SDR family oxidoreductase [Halomonas taeanensis]RAR57681.1 short-subunit dehydrogenase [Halomonas taeanensis]